MVAQTKAADKSILKVCYYIRQVYDQSKGSGMAASFCVFQYCNDTQICSSRIDDDGKIMWDECEVSKITWFIFLGHCF